MSTSQSTTATIPVKKTGSTKTRIEWIDIAIQFCMGLVTTVLALVILYFENLFVQKYMPWSIGKKHVFPRKEIGIS